MSEDVIHEADGYRVRLEVDEGPEKPYNDGGAPIWRLEPSRNWSDRYDATHEDEVTSYETPSRLDEAIGRLWGAPHDLLERYLRIFWGVTASERWHSGNYWYFTCDPKVWREKVGVSDETTQREGYADGLMDEWQAWCNGEVYGVIVERSVRKVTTITAHGDGEVLDTAVDDDAWYEEEAVWGHYGYDWAKQSAIDALSNYVDELAISCDRCPWTVAKVDENERWDALFAHMTGEHQWRLHVWPKGGNGLCQRSGCNVMGTGDFVNDGECEGR